jgi:acetyl-CoA carboxylase carboxyltransferase component
MHCKISGVCHKAFDSDIQAIANTKILLSYLLENLIVAHSDKTKYGAAVTKKLGIWQYLEQYYSL